MWSTNIFRILIRLLAICCALSGENPVAHAQQKTSYQQHQTLDFSSRARDRTPRSVSLDTSALSGSFSLSCWVKAEPDDFAYEILSLIPYKGGRISGRWVIGKQSNDSWYWKYRDKIGREIYAYEPTRQRQAITGKWHLLDLAFDRPQQTVSLYYDGHQVAIYSIPNLPSDAADSIRLQLGGILKGEFNEWDTFNGAVREMHLIKGVYHPSDIIKQYSAVYQSYRSTAISPTSEFSLMTFNIFHGGHETGVQVGPQRVADVIRSSGADIVTMVETYGSGARIADLLGFYFYLRGDNLSILSRYPIRQILPANAPFNSAIARIDVQGFPIVVSCNWLNYPMDYWDKLEKGQAVSTEEWRQFDGEMNAGILRKTLKILEPEIRQADAVPVIVSGDFNSGSHLDWTTQTRHLHAGYTVAFPATTLMERAGFDDSFRTFHPDPLKDPGITWTPAHPEAFQDRIDFIFYKGRKIMPVQSKVINTHPIRYPSDHAAVITTFRIFREPGQPRVFHKK